MSDGQESDEEQSKFHLEIAGRPFNTGQGQTQPTSCTLFSNIMVEKNSTVTPTILYEARRDCRATPRLQIMIFLLPSLLTKEESV